MFNITRKKVLRRIAAALAAIALIIAAGCSGSGNPAKSGNDQNQQGAPSGSQQNEVSNSGVAADPTVVFLKDMMELARQGKVFNCDYPVKTTNMDTVEKAWGKAGQTQYVAAAKGSYATFETREVVFGFNKGGQIFEVRSLAAHQFVSITVAKAEEVFGTPAYDTTYAGQRIIGYQAGPEFKLELVFPQTTANSESPPLEHYNVLYPQGTVNSMADDPGRQW
jgi:hypothetical protein